MELTYDPRYNIAYIKFKEKTEDIDTIQLSEDVNVDISSDGKLYGIEFLNANDQLDILNLHKLFLVNSATGKKEEIEFSI